VDVPSPLHLQRCRRCGARFVPARTLCPVDGSTELEWELSAGAGVVYSATVTRGRDGDRAVCLVDLDEGVRVMAAGAPPIGTRVRLRVEEGRLCAP
jgi:uncharacterized protein